MQVHLITASKMASLARAASGNVMISVKDQKSEPMLVFFLKVLAAVLIVVGVYRIRM